MIDLWLKVLVSVLAIAFIPAMGKVSRMSGGGLPKLPHGLDQWVYALPYLGICLVLAPWWIALIAYGAAVAGKRTGHGRIFIYKRDMEPDSEPEKIEYLILWLYGRIPLPFYKATLAALIGLAATGAPAIVCAMYGHPWAAFALVLSGTLKALAYRGNDTERAERETGWYGGGGVFVVILALLWGA